MKIFTATLATETNTAAVVPTGRVDLAERGKSLVAIIEARLPSIQCFHG